jgi:hypothetical protein
VRISRLQRFQEFMEPLPGALPQAVTFRAFGAETQSFHTPSVAPDARVHSKEINQSNITMRS